MVRWVVVPSTTLPTPPLLSHPLAKCTSNRHLPSRQLPLNELAKRQTRHRTSADSFRQDVINPAKLSQPQRRFSKKTDPVGLSPPFFLQTADNGESRCSIKLPAGSWLPPPSLRSFGTWQKPFGHPSPSLRGGAGAVGIRRPFVRHRFRWRGVPRG